MGPARVLVEDPVKLGWRLAYLWPVGIYVFVALIASRAYDWLDARLRREGL